MTKSDTAVRQPSLWVVCAIIIATAFLAGMATGYIDAMRGQEAATPPATLVFGLVSLAGLAALGLYLARFGRFWDSWSPRKRMYALSIGIAAGLGFGISIGLRHVGGGDGGIDPFGDAQIALLPALVVSAVWIIGMSISIALYQRNIDEHEQRAYLWAGTAGFNALAFVAPVWWLLARAGQLPPVDGMAIFLLAVAVNAAVYLWIKFR